MKRILLVLGLSTCGVFAQWPTNAPQKNATVQLAWDASPDAGVTGYYTYCSTNHGLPVVSKTAAGTNCTCLVSNLAPGVTYYFVVTATNAVGLESDPSNEANYTPPKRPAPPLLKVIIQLSLLGAPSTDGPWCEVMPLPDYVEELAAGEAVGFYRVLATPRVEVIEP
jgi:hypothetical protein